MKDGLLIIERIIIESLSKKERNMQEIILDTNLDHSLLLNILPNLLMKNMIRYTRGTYSIEKENCFQWLNEVNKTDNVKEEAKELFISLVNQYFKKDLVKPVGNETQLKIQKVWLTRDEEVILRSHLSGLDGFFTGVKASRRIKPEREKTCEQRVVIWGLSQYSDLVDGVLEAV
ncbi:MAG: hypothetical protein Q7U04_12370 [Bacteriovorax sp.]|nr:hypothetical protein [Bacteriovorax sp.]